jgi:hypothetical protein
MLWRGKMVSGACLAIAVAAAIGWRADLCRSVDKYHER